MSNEKEKKSEEQKDQVKLDYCNHPYNPEAARNDDDDDPCNPGTYEE